MSIDRQQFRQGQRRRSRAGLLITLILIPLLMGVLACLPVPVGDPEKSLVDPAMSGIWIGEDGGGDASIIVLDPYDKRSWLMSYISFGPEQAPDETQDTEAGESAPELSALQLLRTEGVKIHGFGLYKTWLTTIEDVTFITWESKNLSETLPEMVTEVWWVFRVRKEGTDIFYLDGIDSGADDFEDVKTSKEAEDIIRRHVNDPEFYSNSDGESLKLRRVPESDFETVSRLLEEFGIRDDT